MENELLEGATYMRFSHYVAYLRVPILVLVVISLGFMLSSTMDKALTGSSSAAAASSGGTYSEANNEVEPVEPVPSLELLAEALRQKINPAAP
jgi:hypothetical protein